MCKTLKVSSNGYYSWLRSRGKQEDPMLPHLVKLCFNESMQTYGTRRVKRFLAKEYGWVVSRGRIAKTMKALDLKVKSKKRFRVVTTDSKHNLAISPNRLLQKSDTFGHRIGKHPDGSSGSIRTPRRWTSGRFSIFPTRNNPQIESSQF